MAPPAHMAAAHATSRSKGDSLLVTAAYSAADISRVDVKLVDVASSAVVDQLDGQRTGHLAAAGGLICLVRTGGAGVRVFNPATGAVTDIPSGTTTVEGRTSSAAYVFGQVPATGEYKILRINTTSRGSLREPEQSCEILTLGGGRGQRWRPVQGPPAAVNTTISRQRAVARGFAHFLTTSSYKDEYEYDGIASFDLAKEAWRPSVLRGPLPTKDRHCCHSNLSLVELNGRLVFVHHDYRSFCIDMWVLTDLEKGRWLRRQPLPLRSILRGWDEPAKGQPAPFIPVPREIFAQPLMVLDDGRIAFWAALPNGSVRVYDPKARRCKEVVDMGKTCVLVGLCKGSAS